MTKKTSPSPSGLTHSMPKKLSSKEGGRRSSFYCEWRPGGEPHFLLLFPWLGVWFSVSLLRGGDDIHFDSFISVLFALMRFECRKGERYSQD